MRRLSILLVLALVLTLAGSLVVSAAGTVYVDDCTGTGSGTSGNPYCSIQTGIDNATAGDTISVAAGTYTETLDLKGKSLTIDGAGVASTVVDASTFTGYAISSFGDSTTIRDLKLIGTSRYGFKVSHVSDVTLENIRVEDSGKTGVDLNTVDGATLSNIEVVDTVGGFGIMILDSTDVDVADIMTDNNPWGGVSVQTAGSASDSISFSGSFDAGEDAPLLLEKDPPDYYDITNVDIPSKFGYVVYGFREVDDYKQWFYQETLNDAKAFADALVKSSAHTYRDVLIYDVAEENYHVVQGMSIQDAIDAATHTTINVAAGTYVEQIEITKTLTLKGEGSGTVIQSPDTLTEYYTTSNDNYPIVYVHDVDDVTIQDLVVDGAGKGNANYRFQGIGYHNAGGTVDNVEIKDVRNTPFSGAQHGVALYVYNEDGTSRSITVSNCDIHDFQKNAMALNADSTTPLIVDVHDNQIEGAGILTYDNGDPAQNGIQVWADQGTGTVADNTVSGIAYDNTNNPTKYVACSIFNYYADLNIMGNSISDGHVGLYNFDGAGQISDNTFDIDKVGVSAYGIIATDPPSAVPSPFGEGFETQKSGGLQARQRSTTLDVTVSGNVVEFSGPDNTDTFGIEADAGYGVDDLNFVAEDNTVIGFDVGVEIWECQSSCSSGKFTSVQVNNNRISGNTIGLRSTTDDVTVDAEDNWWGHDSGPEDTVGTVEVDPGACGSATGETMKNDDGIGDLVTGTVDYCPWWSRQDVLDNTPWGHTILLAEGTHTGGWNVKSDGITIEGEPGAIVVHGSPAFTVTADGTNIENLDIDGTGCDSGDSGIVVSDGVSDLWIHDCEIHDWDDDGIHFAGDITDLKLVDNHIHDNGGDGVEFTNTPTTVQIYGNAFRDNTGDGINNNSGSVTAEYNEWGDIDGPTGTNGDGATNVDADPWVFGSLYVDPATQDVREGTQCTIEIKGHAENWQGVEFVLDYDETEVSVISHSNGNFPGDATIFNDTGSEIQYHSYISSTGTTEWDADPDVVLTVTLETKEGFDLPLTSLLDLKDVTLGAKDGVNIFVDSVTDGELRIVGTEVTGRVDLQGRDDDAGAEVDLGAGLTYSHDPDADNTDSWGDYTITDVTSDTYTVTVTMDLYLDASAPVTVTGDSMTLSSLKLLGGDASNDEVIDVSDATIIGNAFGTSSGGTGWNANADINADITVNILDLVLMGGNYNLASSDYTWSP